jgi:NTP pyrophosphatase (non-canonical NTP hydrolase)
MKMNEYQAEVQRTMEGGEGKGDLRLAIFALGVAGEAGEVADLVKKWVGHAKPRDIDVLVGELGDVLWYLSALAHDLGVSLDQVAQKNVAKLRTRYPDGFSFERANAPRPTSSDHPHKGCPECDGRGRIVEDHDGRVGYRPCTGRGGRP